MKIAYVLYTDFTALDLIGPYEVISRWPDAEVHFLARSLEPVRCDEGLNGLNPQSPAFERAACGVQARANTGRVARAIQGHADARPRAARRNAVDARALGRLSRRPAEGSCAEWTGGSGT